MSKFLPRLLTGLEYLGLKFCRPSMDASIPPTNLPACADLVSEPESLPKDSLANEQLIVSHPRQPEGECNPDEQPSALDILLEGLNQVQRTELLTLVRAQGLDANDPILGLIAIGLRNVERDAAFIERMRLRLAEKHNN